MDAEILTVENLKKIYRANTVLDIPAFGLEKGLITALIGPSGAGKSTLLKIINGLVKPDEGRVVFEGAEFSRTRHYGIGAARKMAMVFQAPALFNVSVYENIAFGLKVRRTGRRETAEKVTEIAEWLGLENMLRRKARTLSGGEAIRVSLARAMVLNPRLLLMDEPTANLDPMNVAIIEEMIARANKERGITVLLVTHNMFQARRLGERAVLIISGKIVERAACAEMFENPAHRETSDFISGKMIY
ncbi:MAG: ABC transporter ATP-binding protein [Clostridiales bacterium]|nr:ABC transporter ATP-binding protein [Clostridiales bacterium]